MAGTERQNSRLDGGKGAAASAQPPRKPLQVMHISKREEQERLRKEAEEARAAADAAAARAAQLEQAALAAEGGQSVAPRPPAPPRGSQASSAPSMDPDDDDLAGMTMADLLGPADTGRKLNNAPSEAATASRSVDDFDFDEDAFLAALDANEPVGTTGEVVTGTVIGMESDGVYVDIGGKAPGFMPKSECGLG